MENTVLSLFVNGLMAALLLVTILYCWRLNNRIRILQDSRSELARIIREFNESTERATQSIADIHEATHRISENIQHKIDKANFLATDLELMIEKGQRITGTRADAPTPAASPATRQGGNRVVDQMAARSARPAASPAAEPALAAAAGNVAKAAPLADAADAPRRVAGAASSRPRSRAEQELMNVLKTKSDSGR